MIRPGGLELRARRRVLDVARFVYFTRRPVSRILGLLLVADDFISTEIIFALLFLSQFFRANFPWFFPSTHVKGANCNGVRPPGLRNLSAGGITATLSLDAATSAPALARPAGRYKYRESCLAAFPRARGSSGAC